MRPIRARRGGRRCARSRGSSTRASCARIGVCERQPPQLDEALELAPIAAVQVALSPFDDRALRGGVVERCAERGIARDRALAARRAAPCRPPRASRGARRGRATRTARRRPRSRSPGCSASRPNVVAIPGARRPETARSAAARRDARPRRRRARRALGGLGAPRGPSRPARRRATSSSSWASPAPGRAASPRSYVARGYLRLNRDERGGSLARARRRARRGARVGRRAGRPRQHVPHPRRAEPRRRGGSAATASRPAASGSTRRSPRRRSTSSSACSTASARFRARGAERAGAIASRACSRRRRRCARSASSSRRRRRGLRRRRARAVRADATGRGATGVFVAAAAVAAGREDALADGDRTRRISSSTGGPTASRPTLADAVAPSRGRGPGRSRRALPAPGRSADLLVPPAASGLPLAFARRTRRPGALAPRRHGPAHRTLATTLGARYVTI